MEYFEHCPIPVKGGGDCWAEPHPASRFGLCVAHWREVIEDWAADTPEISRRCRCGYVTRHETVDMFAAYCGLCGERLQQPGLTRKAELAIVARERQEEEAFQEVMERARKDHETKGVVYYLRFGNRIKIGFTERLENRKKQIWHDEVLAVEPGNYQLEHERHGQFAEFKVAGQREWFEAAPELLDFAGAIREERGDPDDLAREIWERNNRRRAAA